MTDLKRTDLPDSHSKVSNQSEFIAHLSTLVEEGSAQDLQEAALAFWAFYPKLSLTFARRVFQALDRLGVPAQHFDPSLLAILARCHLRCGQTERACEYLVAARRIMPPDVASPLVCRVYELEVVASLIHSRLAAAQNAYQRLETYAEATCGGLTSEQLLLGARLHFATGDLSQASQCCARALERAASDEQRYQAQLATLQINEYRDGDIKRELIQLVTLEHEHYVQPHSALSPETRARLFYCLARAFLYQGNLGQAALRFRKTSLRATNPISTPDLLAAALAVVNEHPIEARHQVELMESQNSSGLSQAESLDRNFKTLVLTQMLKGAKQGLTDAEEFYRLCEIAGHAPLRCRGALLLASALIAAGEYQRAYDLLQEDMVQATNHKLLRLIVGGLLALCRASGLDGAIVDFQSLTELLSDEDTTFALAFLIHAHPTFIDLLIAEGLEGRLSPPGRCLLRTQLARMRRVRKERSLLLPPATEVTVPESEERAELLDFHTCKVLPLDHERRLFPVPSQPFSSGGPAYGPGHALRIQLFGSLRVHRRGVRLNLDHLRRNKVRGLLILLALARGREVSRDVILSTLWPLQQDAHSLNNFYVVWNALKKAFLIDEFDISSRFCPPERFPFSSVGGRCALLTEYCDLDLNDFEQLVFRIKNAAYRGQNAQCFLLTDELLAVYQDEVLPADLENERLNRARLYYQNSFVEVMLLVARMALKRRQAAVALPLIERGLTADPHCEELYRLAMHAYVLEGRRDDSLRSYYRCRRYLTEELGIEPNPELTDLFSRLISLPPQTGYAALELPGPAPAPSELRRISPAA